MKRSGLLKRVGLFTVPLAFLLCSGGSATAQEKAQAAASEQQPQAAKAPIPKGCASGKMRCVTNDVRWQAAIAAADRRAKWAKSHGGKVK